jgi:NADPH:quinone reductase-like Zn-dependent oxidoreductase
MNRAIAQNCLHPIVDEVFTFGSLPEAFRRMESGSHFGKLIVRVD